MQQEKIIWNLRQTLVICNKFVFRLFNNWILYIHAYIQYVNLYIVNSIKQLIESFTTIISFDMGIKSLLITENEIKTTQIKRRNKEKNYMKSDS